MGKSEKIITVLVAAFLVLAGSGVYAYVNRDDTPDTVNTTQKASVDDGQENPQPVATEDTPNDSQEAVVEEEPEQTVVVPELDIPDTTGLPVDTNHFKIEEVKADTYLITLYAIINSPSQYAEYQQQLKQYKTEALEYLETNNIDVDVSTINYSPEEAADL
jgi:hypothetical protein